MNGITFDSQKEAERYADLAIMAEHGVTDLVTWGGPPGLPPSVMNASIERFATQVVPRLRERLA